MNPISDKYKSEYCKMLIDHMSKGLSFQAFSGVVKMPRRILYEWKDKYPEFEEAHEIGTGCSLLMYEETATSKSNGTMDEDTAKIADSSMLKFLMASRFRDMYSEKKEIHVKVETLESILYNSMEVSETNKLNEIVKIEDETQDIKEID